MLTLSTIVLSIPPHPWYILDKGWTDEDAQFGRAHFMEHKCKIYVNVDTNPKEPRL